MEMNFGSFPNNDEKVDGMITVRADDTSVFPTLLETRPVYAEKDGYPLHVDLAIPEDALDLRRTYPVIFYVKGSSWNKQRTVRSLLNFAPFVRAGYIGAFIEYRPKQVAPIPAQIEDAFDAIRFLIDNKSRFHIDTDNMFVSGDSSGGHTALSVFATWNTHKFDRGEGELPKLRGCIDFYAPADMSMYAEDFIEIIPELKERFKKSVVAGVDIINDKETARKYSPQYMFKEERKYPPVLICHGSKDTLVPFKQSIRLFERLKEIGVDTEFIKVDGADHGKNLFWTDALFERVIAFLRKNTF